MDRRAFLKTTVAAAGLAGTALPALGKDKPAEAPKKKAVLKLGSQESRLPGKSFREKVLRLEEWGGVGIELHGNPRNRIKQIKKDLEGTKVKVSALCWGSCGGAIVSTDKARRTKGIEQIKAALETAGELQSTGVIFVPCFHKQSKLEPAEIRKMLIDIFPAIGEFAVKCNSRVLLEPLNRKETFYLKTLAQAASICNEINNPGICLMGDFYHMCIEEKSDKAAFVAAGKWCHHVHLASRRRWMPGQDDRSFVEGFRGLKLIGYQDYCSLECGLKKGTKKEEAIPAGFRFLEDQWKKATI